MKIQEAILSEKPIKRPLWQDWIKIRDWQRGSKAIIFLESLTVEDILAEDWLTK